MIPYDIEITLPVTTGGKYGKRLLDFQRFGILNLGTKKVIVKLLAGSEKIDQRYLKNWPCDVEVVNAPSRHHASKISHYYGYMIPSNADSARWYMKVDDDSITDVSGLVDNLDLDYDHTKEYYVCALVTNMECAVEKELLREFGYGRWVDTPRKSLLHEWEANVVSSCAMRRITEDITAMNFLRKRAKVEHSAGDLALCFAARIAKIYPSDGIFMSKDPLLRHFSLLGGPINHIHYLAHDVNGKLFELAKLLFTPSPQKKRIENKTYGLFVDRTAIGLLNFSPSGVIEMHHHPNETFWAFENDKLLLFNDKGVPTGVFNEYHENGDFLTGYKADNTNVKMQLHRVIMP